MAQRPHRSDEEPAVHVIDDDEGVRDSLSVLLDAAHIQVRTYFSAQAFLDIAPTLETGCVLTDVMMPEIDGLVLQQRLTELGIHLPVIVMTAHANVPIAIRALQAGAFDFLEKPFDDERLLATLQRALQHSIVQSDQDRDHRQIVARMQTLTSREHEVLLGLVAGQSNKEIALDLGTSPRTVEVHRARIMEKMAAQSLPELVRLVVRVAPQDRAPPSHRPPARTG